MNVLFLTLAYPEGGKTGNLYADLMREFQIRGDHVFVTCQRERRHGRDTELCDESGISVLRVKTGNVTKTGFIEKGLSTLLLEYQFTNAIMKYYDGIKFDLIIYSTPPITFGRIVEYIKKRDNSRSYLLLKDIFPQNAVDLGLLKKQSILWRYFKHKERRLYNLSDTIGCMSKANVDYILTHNPEIDAKKVEICPNSIQPSQFVPLDESDKVRIRSNFNIPNQAIVFVYGGNLGKPQGIGFLIEILKSLEDKDNVFFYIVGSGTEFNIINSYLQQSNQRNAYLQHYMPKDMFDELLSVSDVGLVFLDPRFTIPNFPSRLNSYMEFNLPIIAATDLCSDIKDMLNDANCGLWCESGDLEMFNAHVIRLSNKDLRKEMGTNGRAYLEEHFTVSKAYDIICSHSEM